MISAHLLWRLTVRLVLRRRLVLLRRRVPVRSGLVRLLVLRRRRPVVPLRRRGTVGRRGAPIVARRCVALLVGRRPTASATVAAAAVVVIPDHHLDVTLGVVRRLSHPGEGDAAGGGVRSGVCLGGDLDAAARAVLQLLDGRATLADDKTHLFRAWVIRGWTVRKKGGMRSCMKRRHRRFMCVRSQHVLVICNLGDSSFPIFQRSCRKVGKSCPQEQKM